MTDAHCSSKQATKTTSVAAALILTACLLGGCKNEVSDSDIKEISVSRVVKLRESKDKNALLVLDARNTTDFGLRRIADSRNLPVEAVSEKRDDIDPFLARFDTLVVVGEDPGSTTAKVVTKRLMYNGYKEVLWLKGGLLEWTRASQPLEGFQIDVERNRARK